MANRQRYLGEFELLVMLAVMHGEGRSHGVQIAQDIEDRTGRDVSRGSLYVTLDRLEAKGYLRSRLEKPDNNRGGKRKRFVSPTRAGLAAVQEAHEALTRMTSGLEDQLT